MRTPRGRSVVAMVSAAVCTILLGHPLGVRVGGWVGADLNEDNFLSSHFQCSWQQQLFGISEFEVHLMMPRKFYSPKVDLK